MTDKSLPAAAAPRPSRYTPEEWEARVRLAAAYRMFDYLGWGARASLVDGGLPLWKKEGRVVSTAAAPPVPAGRFTARVRSESPAA